MIFRVIGALWGESFGDLWIPHTKASEAELWCFLWSAPEITVEKIIDTLVIWDAIALIMTYIESSMMVTYVYMTICWQFFFFEWRILWCFRFSFTIFLIPHHDSYRTPFYVKGIPTCKYNSVFVVKHVLLVYSFVWFFAGKIARALQRECSFSSEKLNELTD